MFGERLRVLVPLSEAEALPTEKWDRSVGVREFGS